eukprot:m.193558 g.193558  ORF g.193558 m.193558 type:complete len:75 (-) comp14881_c0_seq7:350-574(-)
MMMIMLTLSDPLSSSPLPLLSVYRLLHVFVAFASDTAECLFLLLFFAAPSPLPFLLSVRTINFCDFNDSMPFFV